MSFSAVAEQPTIRAIKKEPEIKIGREISTSSDGQRGVCATLKWNRQRGIACGGCGKLQHSYVRLVKNNI